MTQQIIQNLESGLVCRTKINENFTELYANVNSPVNVLAYGAVADGTFNATTGVVGGTDNLAAFNAALSAAATNRRAVYVPGGDYYLSGTLTLPEGVEMYGDGTPGLAKWLNNIRNGTVLMIAGSNGVSCFKWTENSHHGCLRDIGIFQTNTATSRAVIDCTGVLHPRMVRVEYGSLRKTNTAGLLIEPATAGAAYETLYGEFYDLTCVNANAGTAEEGGVAKALVIKSSGLSKRSNANRFVGGTFAGYINALEITSSVSLAGSISVTFTGTVFEGSYNTGMTHNFVSGSTVTSLPSANIYVVRFMNITHSVSASFTGCYFELGGVPATYNDGMNGTASLFPVMWLDSATEVLDTRLDGCSWNSAYLYDNGGRTSCTPDVAGYRYENGRPVMATLRASGAQAIPNATYTALETPTLFAGNLAYLDYDVANKRAIVRSAGAYTITGRVAFGGWATANTFVTSRISAAGTTFAGSLMGQAGVSVPLVSTASVTLLLNAGDTITFEVFQNQGGSQNTDASATGNYLSIVKTA